METLYEPSSDESIIADIILVHGLTGGRISTWSMPSEKEPWPKKFLPKHIPQARISTFGYDAEVVNAWEMTSQIGVRDHARKLVNALVVLREGSPSINQGAPIIFIAHSLGGLVCEEAMVLLSQSTTPSHVRLWCSNIAIMLIGVPHGGSGVAKWAERSAALVPRQVNKKLLQVLRTDSELLSRQQEDFQVAITTGRQGLSQVQIVCFFEELRIRGMKQMVVERSSAQISALYPAIGIRSNHIDLGRFDSEKNETYQYMLRLLKDWTEIRSVFDSTTLEISDGASGDANHEYDSVAAVDNARQFNGDIGLSDGYRRVNSYRQVTATGNSMQINGNITDTTVLADFFRRA
ncbi:hypothetical protein BJ508DRAFT_165203 [Ascobolus immersus RN42]|uniref:DUF676 domain-containing protein n=1 Tax=Ascobolus immersus RN42 TaxID=1160509 RepID=A0A3N4HVL6_ASCIM|nr:hypothetical protein BJ508DRAFT_165203 [Ascobolus immersus RN42]